MSASPHAPALLPVVLAATVGAGVVAQGQHASTPASLDVSKLAPGEMEKYSADWRAAARAHAAGRFDEPAASIARWPAALTHEVIERTLASRVTADGDLAAVIAKGLLLHTDIAIVARAGEAGTRTGTFDAVMLDAKPFGSRLFSIHWSHARVLAGGLVKAGAERPARNASGTSSIATARAWYRAIGALFQQWADLGRLHTHLDHAGGVLGEDPVLLLYAGTLRQAYADARLQSFLVRHRESVRRVPKGVPLDPNVYGTLRFDSAGMELEGAEHALRRALALDPSLVEARIRLAHVLDARGKPAAAAALARQALAAPLPPFLEYYAAMVLGRAEVRLGEHTRAHAAFERAAARYPRSQAAQVALSHVAISGSPGTAAEELVRALGPDGLAVTDDPWALYFRLHEPDAQALLEAFRASVP